MRQRLADSTGRDAELYQVALVDGRFSSVYAQRASYRSYRIPVSFSSSLLSSPIDLLCLVSLNKDR